MQKYDVISIPQILLPQGVDMTLWAVNACDQFTSDYDYWRKLESLVGDSPSALRLIYPEIYLKDDTEARIFAISANMKKYLAGGVFKCVEGGFVLVERTTKHGVRTGIVLAIDLEKYDYKNGSKSLVRSTEATILERIPPRVKIRENAPIELPHIMLLYNDRLGRVLDCVKKGEILYDFDLNMNGGHIRGTYIDNAGEVISSFYSLLEGEEEKLLFAVGDGNHSLATAKACWEDLKKTLTPAEAENHPARYALAEAVNIFDGGLSFEPIHRFIKTEKREEFIKGLHLSGGGKAYIVKDGKRTPVAFPENVPQGIRELDGYISEFIKTYGGEVDYIHGDGEIDMLSRCGVGIALPPIDKEDFFRLIITGGNLPRKTFSMGEGNEKRYYIEAKRIVK